VEEGRIDRAALLRRVATGGAALWVGGLAQAPTLQAASPSTVYPSHPRWRFVLVSHETLNPAFVPTQYGAADAGALLGVDVRWTGSATADVGETVAAFRSAVDGKADAIAVSVIDRSAFESPIRRALGKGIPVVSFNADGGSAGPKARLAYIGEDIRASGLALGQRIGNLVRTGRVAILAATPSQLDLRPRIEAAISAIRQSLKPIEPFVVETSAESVDALSRVDQALGREKDLRGAFALDPISTQALGTVVEKRGYKLVAGGYDVLPPTLDLVQRGIFTFTVDQQRYLQGFFPVLQLFLYKLSGGLIGPANANTGFRFVGKGDAALYLQAKTRFEGSSSKHRYPVR
jgi:simple sugar transport system substrate-binding protein